VLYLLIQRSDDDDEVKRTGKPSIVIHKSQVQRRIERMMMVTTCSLFLRHSSEGVEGEEGESLVHFFSSSAPAVATSTGIRNLQPLNGCRSIELTVNRFS
jgi:hypothetical protein